jgi:hypothetical protein
MKNNTIKFLTIGLALFLVSCSNSTEPVVEESQGPIYRGPYHIEFLACNAGPDYSSENAQQMLAEWKDLDHSDDLRWAGVHAPEGDNNRFDNGWWELEWTSKEAADQAWASENPEFIAWAQKYESVISCDGEGRYPWTFYLPRPSDSFGPVEAEDGYYASAYLACSFNEGYGRQDLRATVVEYNTYLDSANDVGGYYFGVYFPEFDADDDFLWLNAHSNFDGMAAGNADWEINGKEMQAKFDEISTCRTPDLYNSWMLRSVNEEEGES